MTTCVYPVPSLTATVTLPGLGVSGTDADHWYPFARFPNQALVTTPGAVTASTTPTSQWCFLGDDFGDDWAYFGIAVFVTSRRTGAPSTALCQVLCLRIKGTTIETTAPTTVWATGIFNTFRWTRMFYRLLPCEPTGNEVLSVVAFSATEIGARRRIGIVKFLCGTSFASPLIVTRETTDLYVYPHTNEITSQPPFLVVTTTPAGPVLLIGVPVSSLVTESVRRYRFNGSGFIKRPTPAHPTNPTLAKRYTFGSFTVMGPTTVTVRYRRAVTHQYLLWTYGGSPFKWIQVMKVTATGITFGTPMTLWKLWITTPTIGTPPDFDALGLRQRLVQPGIFEVNATLRTGKTVVYWRLTVDTVALTVTTTSRRTIHATCTSKVPNGTFIAGAGNYVIERAKTETHDDSYWIDLMTVTPGKIGPAISFPYTPLAEFSLQTWFYFSVTTAGETKVLVYVPTRQGRECCPGTVPTSGWAVGTVHSGVQGWVVGAPG